MNRPRALSVPAALDGCGYAPQRVGREPSPAQVITPAPSCEGKRLPRTVEGIEPRTE